jgi:rubrerythrin
MQYEFKEQKILLNEIVRNVRHHARFLNTLSLMELCGAHKISRLIKTIPNSSFLLEHVAEEYRHAFYFRRLANKLTDKHYEDFDEENVFCKQKSMTYIHNIDRHICLFLKEHGLLRQEPIHHLAYFLSTLTIERRALPFYRLYQSIIEKHNLAMSIKSVIREEENHLQKMDIQISEKNLPTNLLEHCFAMERITFKSWINAVTKEIQLETSHSIS